MLVADVTSDAAQSVLDTVENLTAHTAPLLTAYTDLEARVRDVMDQERVQRVTLNATLDMRYRGQSYELTVPLEMPIDEYTLGQATGAFHAAHEQRYGYAMEEETVEIVTLRVRGNLPGSPTPVTTLARVRCRRNWSPGGRTPRMVPRKWPCANSCLSP